MEVKVVVSYPDGKSEQKELRDEKANNLLGKKIGDIIEGGILGVTGDLVITGGSDRDGFAMKRDIDGPVRKKVLLSKGVGFNPTRDGERRKKRVRGNMITDEIIQVNTKVIEKPKPKKEKPKEEKPEPEPAKEEKPKEKPKPKKEKPKKEKPEPTEEKKIPLTDVKGIGKKRSEKFEISGVKSANELLSLSVDELVEKTGISEKMIKKFKKNAEEMKEK
ncbi:MAG: 30S ribosomal protein S6e [Euryarchaeota archaeon]|nr:30S ribosomal protein S6e [Euryarchaeota archaeon]